MAPGLELPPAEPLVAPPPLPEHPAAKTTANAPVAIVQRPQRPKALFMPVLPVLAFPWLFQVPGTRRAFHAGVGADPPSKRDQGSRVKGADV
jgi:hypothetical protein